MTMPQTRVCQAAQIAASAKTPVAKRPKEATGQMEPTPRPSWRHRFNHYGVARVLEIEESGTGKPIAHVYGDNVDRAKLICRCVNHHEELLQSLKALLASGDDLAIRLLKENSIFVTESYAVATENGYAAIANVEKGNEYDTKD